MEDVKENISEKEAPKHKGLLDCSLEQLTHKMGNIQPKDVAAKDGMTTNLTWNQVIQGVNFLADQQGLGKILSWKSTAKEAFEAMSRFL